MSEKSTENVKILQKDAPELRLTAEAVPLADISSPKIAAVISRMKKALLEQDDGVAIAAPQIGEGLRIFIVAGSALKMIAEDEGLIDENGNAINVSEKTGTQTSPKFTDQIYINPEIIKASKKMEWMEEGCLGVRYLYGKVKRAPKVTVKAQDELGNIFTRGASGLLAQIFQHEIDHLNGTLFIDTARNIKEVLQV